MIVSRFTNEARRSARRFITTSTPVHLEVDQIIPHGVGKNGPLLILHGLFGSKRNWLSLSKAFAKDLQRPVYSLDLRNHGASPHAEPMTYTSMALDVVQFCKQHSLSDISLLGHSMGGKVAMTLALDPSTPKELLQNLIIADIAPSKGPLSPEFTSYVDAMRKIEESEVGSRKEAQDILSEYEQDPMIRAFLLTNLVSDHHRMKFRIPIDIIGRSISEIGSFPYEPGEKTWEGPTLFVKGTKSKYINSKNIPLAKEYFPNMVVETLDAGHWERPNEFKQLVVDFIKANEDRTL
ncbi:hypothetical protein JAAARDRAFT_57066 [Jaapia argillacea MUCL 33604]|uniref:AB hydrolase-1 domain-containing protein n=1 Tax=Jaapia argillacea MUCL 33604 TaxID=933084 RepID=A0A067Q916_9AGAM|nr:hypothetical protein JAAARDRAFT_57066 [Jaapia argillacea MUCL 33604]